MAMAKLRLATNVYRSAPNAGMVNVLRLRSVNVTLDSVDQLVTSVSLLNMYTFYTFHSLAFFCHSLKFALLDFGDANARTNANALTESATCKQVCVNAPKDIRVKNAKKSAQAIGMAFNVPKCVVAPMAANAIMCPASVHVRLDGLVRCAWISVRLEHTAMRASKNVNVKMAGSVNRRRVVVIVRQAGQAMCVQTGAQRDTLGRDARKCVSVSTVLIVIT